MVKRTGTVNGAGPIGKGKRSGGGRAQVPSEGRSGSASQGRKQGPGHRRRSGQGVTEDGAGAGAHGRAAAKRGPGAKEPNSKRVGGKSAGAKIAGVQGAGSRGAGTAGSASKAAANKGGGNRVYANKGDDGRDREPRSKRSGPRGASERRGASQTRGPSQTRASETAGRPSKPAIKQRAAGPGDGAGPARAARPHPARSSQRRGAPVGGRGPAEPTRIAKVMARAGLCSRRDAERWIEEGRVKVNGKTLASPARDVDATDRILVDDAPLPGQEPARLWRYYKPRGQVTTNRDPQGRPTVFEHLPPELPRVVSVGRLDLTTEGLLLLTTDGDLARYLELPATGWLRRYRVRAHGRVTQSELEALQDGLTVEGVRYGPIEATLDREQGANVWLTMAIREGKNREIRRVLATLDLEVNRLIRVSYGPFQLNDMAPGTAALVRRRTLIDQLGPKLTARFGLADEGPPEEPEEQAPRRPGARARAAPSQAAKAAGQAGPKPAPKGGKTPGAKVTGNVTSGGKASKAGDARSRSATGTTPGMERRGGAKASKPTKPSARDRAKPSAAAASAWRGASSPSKRGGKR